MKKRKKLRMLTQEERGQELAIKYGIRGLGGAWTSQMDHGPARWIMDQPDGSWTM